MLFFYIATLFELVKASVQQFDAEVTYKTQGDRYFTYLKTSHEEYYYLAQPSAEIFAHGNQILSSIEFKRDLHLEIHNLPSILINRCDTQLSGPHQKYKFVSSLGERKLKAFKNLFSIDNSPEGIHFAGLFRSTASSPNKHFEQCVAEAVNQSIENLHKKYQLLQESDTQPKHDSDANIRFYLKFAINECIVLAFLIFRCWRNGELAAFVLKYFPYRDKINLGINEARIEKIDLDDELIPSEYKCLISLEVMDKPVRTYDATSESGNLNFDKLPSYEESQIKNWLNRYNYPPHNPSVFLQNKSLKPDNVLKGKIENFIRHHESLFTKKIEIKIKDRARVLRSRSM